MRSAARLLPATFVLFALYSLVVSCNSSNPTSPGGGAELSGSLPVGGSPYMHTFARAGTYNYHCTIHPSCSSLDGSIVVVPPGSPVLFRSLAISISGGSSGAYGSTCAALSLQQDTVYVGDQVTWNNASPLPHTVTSQ